MTHFPYDDLPDTSHRSLPKTTASASEAETPAEETSARDIPPPFLGHSLAHRIEELPDA